MSASFEDLVLVGLSHATADTALRERCAVPAEELEAELDALRAQARASGAWILSTCNRTEALLCAPDAEKAAKVFRERRLAPAEGFADAIYEHHGLGAVLHLFSVAAGLDSLVLGESEILRQVKRAYEEARRVGTCDETLDALLRQTLEVGKRVRRDTRLGEGTLSVARAALELASKVFGSFRKVSALLIGTGETGLLVGRHLKDLGVGRLVLCNRTRARAERAAEELSADEVIDFEDRGSRVSEFNLTVVSVEAPEPVLRREHFKASRLRRHDRPAVVLDLSVPRGVSEDVTKLPELLLHGLDDLDRIVAGHREQRRAEMEAVGQILVEEAHKFLSLRVYAGFKPLIRDLGERFEGARCEMISRHPEFGEDVQKATQRLTKTLLGIALQQLKLSARHTQSETLVKTSYQRYLGARSRP